MCCEPSATHALIVERMFNSIRQFFAEHLAESQTAGAVSEYQRATAALLLEVMHADAEVSLDESAAVTRALQSAFDMDAETVREIVALAESERDAATCLHEFTRSVNNTLDAAGRGRIVELLWQVAYADGRLDVYEEHLVRKVADLLHVPHSVYIHAKLKAGPRT